MFYSTHEKTLYGATPMPELFAAVITKNLKKVSKFNKKVNIYFLIDYRIR
jgi:hypothetical protein